MDAPKIKAVVWDLDNTIWNGILLENDKLSLKKDIVDTIITLDKRGILQSIVSKNDYTAAIDKLKQFQLDKYFLYPQIHWGAKSTSVKTIADKLNLALNTFAFIDDSQFELSEVKTTLPEVTCILAEEHLAVLENPRFIPRFITNDSKNRRRLYQADEVRNRIEANFSDPKESFLSSLNMEFTISEASENDLQRAVELTERTNQLNSTGKIYSYKELLSCINSGDYKVYICDLNDKFGSYGKIGLAVVKTTTNVDYLELLLMSCRVMSRGVGTVLLSYILNNAKLKSKTVETVFHETGKNELMYITLKFANFKEKESTTSSKKLLYNDLSYIHDYPNYITLTTDIGETIYAT